MFALEPGLGPALFDAPVGVEGEYEFGKVLGSGMFSTVRLATHKLTGLTVAVKMLNTMANGREVLDAEIRAMKKAKGHPNVVTLYEVIESESDGMTYMIMEYCPRGTMHDYLERNGPVGEDMARRWTRQLIEALAHCHRRRVVHLDIKPANIYLDDDLNVKLGDFGLSAGSLNAYTDKLTCSTGSPVYASPEVYMAAQGIPYTGPPAAMWAAGITLHAMLTCTLPFTPEDFQDTWDNYTPAPHVSDKCKEFLRRALKVNVSERLGEDEALRHPWLSPQCGCPGFNRTESMECFLKLRMCQLGFTATAAESAAKSTAVMDPAAATFSILQSALAKTYKPVTAARVSSLVRRVPSENNFARLQAQKAT